MKKSFTLLMALSLVMSLMAMPVNPKVKQDSKGRKVEQQVEQTTLAREAHFVAAHVAQMNVAQQAVRPVHMGKKSAIRKATAPVTFSGSDFTGGVSGDGGDFTITKNNVTITLKKAYGTGSQLRVYSGGSMTITATEAMTNITFDNDGNAKLVLSDQTPNATSWSVSATAQIRLNEIVVSFAGSQPEPLDTLTVAEALAEAKKLAGGASSSKKYVIEGYVSTVDYAYSQGKETFYMTDTKGDRTGELQAYKCALDEAAEEDYKVSVTGKLMNYVKNTTSTYEITGGSAKILEKPEGSDTVYVNTIQYADAYYYQDGEGYYWDFDLYYDMTTDYEIVYPRFYYMCDDEAESKTAISGSWNMYYAGYWASENDSIVIDDGEALTVTVNDDGTYNFSGTYYGENGEVVVIDAKNVDVYAWDADNDYEEIELDEQGGGSAGDTVQVAVNYVQAVRYDSYSETGAYLWEFDAMNVTSNTQFESMWFYIYTAQNNRLEGEYNIESDNIYSLYGLYYYTGYTKVNGTDTTNVWAGTDNIELVIAYDEVAKAYDVYAEFLDEEGKTLYQFEVENIAIDAFNEEEVDITLMDSVAFVADTIAITGQDAIEFAYYPSYSEEGAYNYSVNLYSEANTVPYLALDVYSDEEGILVGTYCEDNENVGEYCGFYPTMDDQLSVSNLMCTITEKAGVYTVKGSFTGSDMNIYTFEVTAVAIWSDGDYPYEPMEKQSDITMNVTSHAFDDSYFDTYGEVDVYFYNATDTIQLWVASSTSTLADGTYTITTAEEAKDGEMYAGYYSSYGLGGCIALIKGDLYYLVSGTMTIATSGSQTTITLDATSAHGTKIGLSYVIENPTGLTNIEAAKQNGKYILDGELYIQKNGVLYNAQGQMVK